MSFFSKASFSYSGGPGKSNFLSSLWCPNYSSSSFWKKVGALSLNNPKVSMEDRLILKQGSSLLAFLMTPIKASFPSNASHERDQYSKITRVAPHLSQLWLRDKHSKVTMMCYALCYPIKFFILRYHNSKKGVYPSHFSTTQFFLFFFLLSLWTGIIGNIQCTLKPFTEFSIHIWPNSAVTFFTTIVHEVSIYRLEKIVLS